ncbi:MAG TPA: cupredoxin domain-containing protein [Actinomycetota bacterium]|nr:cupredoxin domain-containing protein [Actinomycetota bacterium]
MNPEIRDRFLLPVAIPVGVVIVIATLALLMSSVLLNVPREVAVAVAMMTAFNILAGASVLALRDRVTALHAIPMVAVALLPLIIGGAIAAGVVPLKETEGPEGTEVPSVALIEISADNLLFDKTQLDLPADKPFKLRFDNREDQLHNVQILKEKAGETLFIQPFFKGPSKVTWDVSPIPAGTYYFQCQIHPTTMFGKVVVT